MWPTTKNPKQVKIIERNHVVEPFCPFEGLALSSRALRISTQERSADPLQSGRACWSFRLFSLFRFCIYNNRIVTPTRGNRAQVLCFRGFSTPGSWKSAPGTGKPKPGSGNPKPGTGNPCNQEPEFRSQKTGIRSQKTGIQAISSLGNRESGCSPLGLGVRC